ncbi:WG repeat-containing protein [Flavobacterium sp. P21]
MGFLSKDGSFKIEPQFKSARSFSEGLACRRK